MKVRGMKIARSWDRRVQATKWREAGEPEGTSVGTYPLPRAPFAWVGLAETHTQTHPACAHLGLTC